MVVVKPGGGGYHETRKKENSVQGASKRTLWMPKLFLVEPWHAQPTFHEHLKRYWCSGTMVIEWAGVSLPSELVL